ncbi:hypothetical protein FRC09_004298 [Ceratobasidium sp. 395]|nr:hypothetical protein FRC09_004298 [Ceratobasidium sp. 395]
MSSTPTPDLESDQSSTTNAQSATTTSDAQVSGGSRIEAATKKQVKRALNKSLAGKALELDKNMREAIKAGAEEIGVSEDKLADRFKLMAPVGETRKPMWWNGLVAEKSEEWKAEYDGPPRKFLPWVTNRIRSKGLNEDLSNEEKEMYAKKAAETRASNKEEKAVSGNRAKILKGAEERLDALYHELQNLNAQLGIEFALFATRRSVEDQLNPVFVCSDKAELFFQGHLKMPPKELLKLMDVSIVAGRSQAQRPTKGRSIVKQYEADLTHRSVSVGSRVCVRYLANCCLKSGAVLKSLGHDTAKFKHIKYSNYGELVDEYHIILRGYPLTPDGQIVSPSNFPKGIPGLINAEKHLGSGAWGFEKIRDSTYKDWKADCKIAEDKGEAMPLPPHIHVPGTDVPVVKVSKKTPTEEDGASGSRKRGKAGSGGERPKKRITGKGKASVSAAYKSKEIIDSDEDESEIEEAEVDK